MLFIMLPISDKRNLIRCNKELNIKKNLMSNYENEFMAKIKKTYQYYLPTEIRLVEKYTIEILYDGYEHLIPKTYICKQNKLCNETGFMYFYCSVMKNLELLKNLLHFNFRHSIYVSYGAAFNGDLEVLKWARENGYNWDSWTCCSAAQNGHLEVLKWARENGCDWNSSTCAWAAENGHLEILKWARENGCNWNSSTCSNAAENGHLEVLKWARENGCKWDSNTCSWAAQNGHLEVLKWARENGCKWNSSTSSFAALNGHLEVLKWGIFFGYTCIRKKSPEKMVVIGILVQLV